MNNFDPIDAGVKAMRFVRRFGHGEDEAMGIVGSLGLLDAGGFCLWSYLAYDELKNGGIPDADDFEYMQKTLRFIEDEPTGQYLELLTRWFGPEHRPELLRFSFGIMACVASNWLDVDDPVIGEFVVHGDAQVNLVAMTELAGWDEVHVFTPDNGMDREVLILQTPVGNIACVYRSELDTPDGFARCSFSFAR